MELKKKNENPFSKSTSKEIARTPNHVTDDVSGLPHMFPDILAK